MRRKTDFLLTPHSSLLTPHSEPTMTLPALLGGLPIRPQGPPDWPPPDDAVWQTLHSAYRDGSWGKYAGGNVERLEQRLAHNHAVEFALTCGSGTFAVELALRALKVGSGDEVVLAAYDYPANFLGIHAIGATPVLIDVAAHNWNFDVDRLAAAYTPATRAIIVAALARRSGADEAGHRGGAGGGRRRHRGCVSSGGRRSSKADPPVRGAMLAC